MMDPNDYQKLKNAYHPAPYPYPYKDGIYVNASFDLTVVVELPYWLAVRTTINHDLTERVAEYWEAFESPWRADLDNAPLAAAVVCAWRATLALDEDDPDRVAFENLWTQMIRDANDGKPTTQFINLWLVKHADRMASLYGAKSPVFRHPALPVDLFGDRINGYNFENAFGENLEWFYFEDEGDPFLILIADKRLIVLEARPMVDGGYFWDFQDYGATCYKCGIYWSTWSDGYHLINDSDSNDRLPDSTIPFEETGAKRMSPGLARKWAARGKLIQRIVGKPLGFDHHTYRVYCPHCGHGLTFQTTSSI